MPGAVRNTLENGAEQVAPVMRQIETEDQSFGMRIVERCAFAGEVGQNQQTLGAGRGCFRFGGELRDRSSAGHFAREIVAKPVGERAAGRKSGHCRVLALE